MPQTILHVEDDAALAEIVQLSLTSFGFRGTTLSAETVGEAAAILDDTARRGGTIDLIISDMVLPDGSGLEVVSHARHNLAWKRTPILILSGDADPERVGRAYALGANSYVSKAPRGRSLAEVVRTLYDHWLRDVKLPGASPTDRTTQVIDRSRALRGRHADFYMRMADLFADRPSEVAFWLTRALSEANLTNLLAFLHRQLDGRPLPPEVLDEIEQAQDETDRALRTIDRAIAARPITSRAEAYRRMLELVSTVKVQAYARSLSYLFPVVPVATVALVDLLVSNFLELARWIDTHSTDAELHRQASLLRADAAYLRTLSEGAPRDPGARGA